MTPIEFLRARLDEAAQRAHGSGRVAWLTYRDADGGMLYTTAASATIEAPDDWVVGGREAAGTGNGVVRTAVEVIYDERDVLAEVDAKRRIVDEHWEPTSPHGDWPTSAPGRRCPTCWDQDERLHQRPGWTW